MEIIVPVMLAFFNPFTFFISPFMKFIGNYSKSIDTEFWIVSIFVWLSYSSSECFYGNLGTLNGITFPLCLMENFGHLYPNWTSTESWEMNIWRYTTTAYYYNTSSMYLNEHICNLSVSIPLLTFSK